MCVKNSCLSIVLGLSIVLMGSAVPGLGQNETTLRQDCGSTQRMVDDCFKDLPPHLMEFLQNTKIIISKSDITTKCNIFNRGMRCFDAYSKRCLNDRKLDTFKINVEGARRFFYKFCGDTDFQRDYLRHKDCFAYIQLDWVSCTSEFEGILSDEVHDATRNTSDKFIEFCCAPLLPYEILHLQSARDTSATRIQRSLARETAKMLSDEKHFRELRRSREHLRKSLTAGPPLAGCTAEPAPGSVTRMRQKKSMYEYVRPTAKRTVNVDMQQGDIRCASGSPLR
ncbi:GL23512 [Drosophila persimilis]|uniref:GL23512 n=1 Tax=Drosophila persimilis TaxID=7234 RepID=B4G315_DROPE|nr:GL23512 [Drosophila persimilis]